MLEPLDMTDWTALACPHCGWMWHSIEGLARHVATLHGARREVALMHARAIGVYVTRLRRTIERDASTASAQTSQVSEVQPRRRMRS